MGGMITQELLLLVPKGTIAAAVLLSTTPGRRLPPMSMFTGASPLGAPKEPKARVEWAVKVLFPDEWRAKPYKGTWTRFDGTKFDTNLDYVTYFSTWRLSLTTVQRPEGSSAQGGACIRHYVSPQRLAQIKASGVPMLVITGTIDNLIRPADSTYLAKHLDCPLLIMEGGGHALSSERPEDLNHAVMEHFRETIQKLKLETPEDYKEEQVHPIEHQGQTIAELAKGHVKNKPLDDAIHSDLPPSGIKPSASFTLHEYWA
jgi:pimeloyl-ACP methyl ester carboxylesterase